MEQQQDPGSLDVSHLLDTPDLGDLFRECLASFRNLLLSLQILLSLQTSEPATDHDGGLTPELVRKAFEEYGRLRVWGDDFRANLPDGARSSLGDRLRRQPELRSQVVDHFRSLSRQIGLARHTLNGSPSQDNAKDNVSESDDSESSDDGSSEGDENPLRNFLRGIFDQVQLLFHLGSLLRLPDLSRQYLKSKGKTQSSVGLLPEDVSHVRETMKRWRHNEAQSVAGTDDENLVIWPDTPRRNNEDSESEALDAELIERLAFANGKRRGQLMYWREHPDKTPSIRRGGAIGHAKLPQTPRPERRLDDGNSASISVFSNDRVAESDIFGPTRPLGLLLEAATPSRTARTTYSETVVGGSHSSRVPDVPDESKHAETFTCPYCGLELESAAMADRMIWKRHVFRDLRPYVCLHTPCLTQEKLYATRHDWIYHETQMHWRQWTCRDCEAIFSSREHMAAHLRLRHTSMAASQEHDKAQDTLLALYEHAMDRSHPVSCPLCGRPSSLEAMLTHLGRHMEELSLFALPRPEIGEDEEDQDGTESNAASSASPESPWEGRVDPSLHGSNATGSRPFNCLFSFAGCGYTSATAAEWKQHIHLHHLRLGYWVCTEGVCAKRTYFVLPGSHLPYISPVSLSFSGQPLPDPGISKSGVPFINKTSYPRHLKRIHMPRDIQHLHWRRVEDAALRTLEQQVILDNWDARARDAQAANFRLRCEVPRHISCPAHTCQHEPFTGPDVWDTLLDHIAVEHRGWVNSASVRFDAEKSGLLAWLAREDVGILRRDGGKEGGKWRLNLGFDANPWWRHRPGTVSGVGGKRVEKVDMQVNEVTEGSGGVPVVLASADHEKEEGGDEVVVVSKDVWGHGD
ncbi:hypothetical protein B0I37DRAFT_196029 [Chaetomium sp. MPI-CAGE-AT-0009]|nr:hypothetical protein B0I37DRAFT_196029 [Chaetomium sp. MPI-CAGE-AT-0009]